MANLARNDALWLDLAKQMLLMLRRSVSCRLWVAMDRWYLSNSQVKLHRV